jgi:hypothetical protein
MESNRNKHKAGNNMKSELSQTIKTIIASTTKLNEAASEVVANAPTNNQGVYQFAVGALTFADIIHTWYWDTRSKSERETLSEFCNAVRAAIDGIVEAYVVGGGQLTNMNVAQLGDINNQHDTVNLIRKFKASVDNMLAGTSLSTSVRFEFESLVEVIDNYALTLKLI